VKFLPYVINCPSTDFRMLIGVAAQLMGGFVLDADQV
jgi:hypothetical protein